MVMGLYPQDQGTESDQSFFGGNFKPLRYTQDFGGQTPMQPQEDMYSDPGILDPGTGESYLFEKPVWGGAGGGQQAAEVYAYEDFMKQFGRPPTRSELNRLSAAYVGGDPNRANLTGGRSAVSEYFQSLTNTPANYYERQQKMWKQKAPEHYDSVKQLFQSIYGRDPDSNEIEHYSTLLASGQANPYQLGQFLQSMPEYQNTQDKKFRGELAGELEGYDKSFFNRGKEDIISRYAQMGRSTSPALDVALTDLQAKLNENRGKYLAELSASQYGGNKENAIRGYGRTQEDVMGRINSTGNVQYDNFNNLTNRIREMSDYAQQSRDWGSAMDRYGQNEPGALDYINTAANIVGAFGGAKGG